MPIPHAEYYTAASIHRVAANKSSRTHLPLCATIGPSPLSDKRTDQSQPVEDETERVADSSVERAEGLNCAHKVEHRRGEAEHQGGDQHDAPQPLSRTRSVAYALEAYLACTAQLQHRPRAEGERKVEDEECQRESRHRDHLRI